MLARLLDVHARVATLADSAVERQHLREQIQHMLYRTSASLPPRCIVESRIIIPWAQSYQKPRSDPTGSGTPSAPCRSTLPHRQQVQLIPPVSHSTLHNPHPHHAVNLRAPHSVSPLAISCIKNASFSSTSVGNPSACACSTASRSSLRCAALCASAPAFAALLSRFFSRLRFLRKSGSLRRL